MSADTQSQMSNNSTPDSVQPSYFSFDDEDSFCSAALALEQSICIPAAQTVGRKRVSDTFSFNSPNDSATATQTESASSLKRQATLPVTSQPLDSLSPVPLLRQATESSSNNAVISSVTPQLPYGSSQTSASQLPAHSSAAVLLPLPCSAAPPSLWWTQLISLVADFLPSQKHKCYLCADMPGHTIDACELYARKVCFQCGSLNHKPCPFGIVRFAPRTCCFSCWLPAFHKKPGDTSRTQGQRNAFVYGEDIQSCSARGNWFKALILLGVHFKLPGVPTSANFHSWVFQASWEQKVCAALQTVKYLQGSANNAAPAKLPVKR